MKPITVTIIGGGMITNDLLLPAIYHLQRVGTVGEIQICALNSAPLRALRDNAELHDDFPGQIFRAHPDFQELPERLFPELYKEVLAGLPPHQAVVVAVPDQFHYPVVRGQLGGALSVYQRAVEPAGGEPLGRRAGARADRPAHAATR